MLIEVARTVFDNDELDNRMTYSKTSSHLRFIDLGDYWTPVCIAVMPRSRGSP
jgi:hypothetical protein